MALFACLGVSASRGTDATGTLCINNFAATKADPCPVRQPDEAGDARWVFTVQVDDREPVQISCRLSATITGLALDERHRVRILRDGEAKETFFFRFSQHRTDRLCLDYGTYYNTWMLTALRHGTDRPCRCVPSLAPD